jgi:hypothetical protein
MLNLGGRGPCTKLDRVFAENGVQVATDGVNDEGNTQIVEVRGKFLLNVQDLEYIQDCDRCKELDRFITQK